MPIEGDATLNIVCDNPACPGNALDATIRDGWLMASGEVYREGPTTHRVYCSSSCLAADVDALAVRDESYGQFVGTPVDVAPAEAPA